MLWCCEDAPHDHKNKKEFDCVQRAHQNTLENLPIVVFSALLSGLKYPLYAGAFLTIWNIGRVIYARGFVYRHHLRCTTGHRHHPTPTNTPITMVQRWAPQAVRCGALSIYLYAVGFAHQQTLPLLSFAHSHVNSQPLRTHSLTHVFTIIASHTAAASRALL